MKIIPTKQLDDSACGPTSIHMVLTYFDIPHKLSEISKLSQYRQKDGLSNQDLVKTLEKFDLKTKEKANAKWDDLVKYNTKHNVIIVSWMMKGYIGHFSVVNQVREKFIELADPERGAINKIDKLIFMRLWLDYDNMWYPIKNTDIQLRWMCVVSKNKTN